MTVHVLGAAAAATLQVTPFRRTATVHVNAGVPVTVNPLIGVSDNCAVAELLGLRVNFAGDTAS